MATKTILRNIGGANDMVAALKNSTLRRTLSIGTTWQKVRVGVRYTFAGASANLLSTPVLALGVCSGTANPVNNGSATTDHFLGIVTTMLEWQYFPGPPAYFAAGSTYKTRSAKRVGTTWTYTDQTNNLAYTFYPSADPSVRELLFVDIVKASPRYQIGCFCKSSLNVNRVDVSYDTFIQYMTLEAPVLSGSSNSPPSASYNGISADEAADGYLDTVNVAWDRSVPSFEISDIAVTRFA